MRSKVVTQHMTLRPHWSVVQGRRMYARLYEPEGAARPPSLSGVSNVVMVHGLGISSVYMVPTARRLARHFSVYAPDLPGFGKSERPPHVLDVREMALAIDEWMTAAGLEKAHFVGNSIGCQVISHLAVMHPERIEKLVFVGPTFDRASRYVLPLLLRAFFDSRWEPSSLSRLVVKDYLSAGPVRLIKTLKYALQDPVERLFPRIDAPVLVVRGQHDAVVPQNWARRVARLLPRAELYVIKGASHAVHYSDPDKFVELALPFLMGNS